MQDPTAFESFIRGIPTDMPPFAITEITKLSDTGFDVFLDIQPEYRGKMGLPENREANDQEHDFRILMHYHPQGSTLSMGLYVETGIPHAAYGWALGCLNRFNMFGNDYVSKVFLPDPDPENGEALMLIMGWEVGLYEPSLLEGEGLKALTTLVHSIMRRLCAETSTMSIQLTQLFHVEFPTGKFDA